MAKALSKDLRVRVIEAVRAGSSRRQVAARFGVSASSAIRWVNRFEATGEVSAKPMGGDRRSLLKGHREGVLALVSDHPDQTIEELRARLRERGIEASYGATWRFLDSEEITFKKNRFR